VVGGVVVVGVVVVCNGGVQWWCAMVVCNGVCRVVSWGFD